MTMRKTTKSLVIATLISLPLMQASAQPARPSADPAAPTSPYTYADVADHAVAAATIVDARIRSVRQVESARAPGLAPGSARFYVAGDVQAVLFGRDPVARRIAWLVDLPMGADGRTPRVARQRVLLFARPVSAANQLVLVGPQAMVPWDPQVEAHARSIASELARGTPPARITGVSQAFHAAGTVPGEGETQIFLSTASGDPISLSVLRRPGQQRSWAAAFGEIVDEAAGPPRPGTIGHYRLACGLPASLPTAALADASASDAATARDDYAFVRAQVGPCQRGSGVATR